MQVKERERRRDEVEYKRLIMFRIYREITNSGYHKVIVFYNKMSDASFVEEKFQLFDVCNGDRGGEACEEVK